MYGEIEEVEDIEQVERKFHEFEHFDILGNDPKNHHYYYRRGNTRARIEKEWESIRLAQSPDRKKGLGGSIFVRVYDQRIDLMSVMIVGRETSPIHQGLFFFDIFFPSDYLKQPRKEKEADVPQPQLFYHSFAFDLNTNLRRNGEVLLPHNKYSNTLELLSALKDLVVHEKLYVDDSQNGLKLNKRVFILTCETMLKMLKNPPGPFRDFVLGYFRTRAHYILLNYKACADLEDKAMSRLFFKLVRAFEANGTYCGHHYNKKQYDRALEEEEELLRQRYGYGDVWSSTWILGNIDVMEKFSDLGATMKETPYELRKQNAALKSSLDALDKKNSNLENELLRAQKNSDDTIKNLQEYEHKCYDLQLNVNSLKEKLSLLEDENHIMLQKALDVTPKSTRRGFDKATVPEVMYE